MSKVASLILDLPVEPNGTTLSLLFQGRGGWSFCCDFVTLLFKPSVSLKFSFSDSCQLLQQSCSAALDQGRLKAASQEINKETMWL